MGSGAEKENEKVNVSYIFLVLLLWSKKFQLELCSYIEIKSSWLSGFKPIL